MMECKERIVKYWTRRRDSFKKQRKDELHDAIAMRWLLEIEEVIPKGASLRILDVGCGAGYFSILLSKRGHQVTGIDLTPDMIEGARQLAREEEAVCQFLIMDAEKLDFPDESFDVVISRNLTWTLPHPGEAYGEWLRVLKKGGVLLNFDADYGLEDSEDVSGLPPMHAHHMIGAQLRHENNEIKKSLPISSQRRPGWDVSVLKELGVKTCQVDSEVSKRIYTRMDGFYNPTPMFKLWVRKE